MQSRLTEVMVGFPIAGPVKHPVPVPLLADSARASHASRRAAESGFSLLEVVAVVGVIGVVAAIAVTISLGSVRLIADARRIKNQISLARMQAAANFTRARVYIDLVARSYRIETWRAIGIPAWVAQGGPTYLSSAAELYGFGPVSAPPPSTQATIAQAPACRDAAGTVIANTAPRVGIGNCSNGNVSALSSSGGASVNGHDPPTAADIVQLPAAVHPPTPPDASPAPPTSGYNGNGQTLLGGASVGDVTVNANATLTLGAPGVTSIITVNSIKLVGNGTLNILGTVILKVADQNHVTNPIDFTGGSVTNASLDPSHFQILYGGTGGVQLNGGATTAAVVYAPNAAVTFNGGGDFYGSVVGSTVDDTGGALIHYDRHLSQSFFSVGNTMMTSFSWKKY